MFLIRNSLLICCGVEFLEIPFVLWHNFVGRMLRKTSLVFWRIFISPPLRLLYTKDKCEWRWFLDSFLSGLYFLSTWSLLRQEWWGLGTQYLYKYEIEHAAYFCFFLVSRLLSLHVLYIVSSCFYLVAKEWIPIQKPERVAMFYQHSWYYVLYSFCLGLVWLKCCLQTPTRGGHKETIISKNFPQFTSNSAH